MSSKKKKGKNERQVSKKYIEKKNSRSAPPLRVE